MLIHSQDVVGFQNRPDLPNVGNGHMLRFGFSWLDPCVGIQEHNARSWQPLELRDHESAVCPPGLVIEDIGDNLNLRICNLGEGLNIVQLGEVIPDSVWNLFVALRSLEDSLGEIAEASNLDDEANLEDIGEPN